MMKDLKSTKLQVSVRPGVVIISIIEVEWKERVLFEYRQNEREESKPWDVVILDEAHKIKVSPNIRSIVPNQSILCSFSCRIRPTKLHKLSVLCDAIHASY